jgi:hypothetical protein
VGFKVISQQPVKESVNGGVRPEPAAIRTQLQRLLAHPLFTHSKRYPVLLAYTVEQTLLGNSPRLKERTIGIEAFGRKPDYDANADPVVRTTAAEVRKRLIQYYYDPSHAGEPIIELSAGSYVPAFRQSSAPRIAPSKEDSELLQRKLPLTETRSMRVVTPSLAFHRLAANRGHFSVTARPSTGRWILAVLSGMLVAMIGFGIGHYRLVQAVSNVDRFWEPVTSSPYPTTYCLGEPDHRTVPETTQPGKGTATVSSEQQLQDELRFSGRLNMSDVVTLTHTTAPLAAHHGAFRVLPASETSFTQLREGPDVLIGAFDNPWTLRITQALHYGFLTKESSWQIVDHRSQQPSPWAVQMNLPIQNLARDYAIVARIHDNTTGQPVIIVAGISDQGTEAAGEVVYNPVYLKSLLDRAPKDWNRRNLEAVIGTRVIDGHPGPPDILAVHTW